MGDESAPETSAFDLGNLFGLNGIGDIGTAFGLFKRALSGEEISADDIPSSMNSRILQMAMQSVGAQTIDEFLTKPEILQQIVAGLKEDTQDPDKPFGEKIIVQYVAGLEDSELREVLKANPTLLETVVTEMDAEDFRPIIEAQVNTALETKTVRDLLTEQNIEESAINSFPTSFLNEILKDLDTTDILGTVSADGSVTGAFSNEQIITLVSILPSEQLQTLATKLNENLPEDGQIEFASDATYDQKRQIITDAIEAVDDHGGFALDIRNAWKSVTSGETVTTESTIIDAIKAEIPAALAQLKGDAADVDKILAEFDPASIDFENLDIDETFPPGRLKELVDANMEKIAAALGKEENWPMIEAMVLANNGALIKQNRDRIIEAMIPEMTQQGLNSFNNLMDQLPPEFRQIIQSLLNTFGGFLQQFGIDINMDAPTPDRTAPEPPTTPEQDQPPSTEQVVPPVVAPGN